MHCSGKHYRRYSAKSGNISSLADTNLIAYFYDDGSLESLWTGETDWVFFPMGETFYPGVHESELPYWSLYSDGAKVEDAHLSRSLVPRWANAMPCQYVSAVLSSPSLSLCPLSLSLSTFDD